MESVVQRRTVKSPIGLPVRILIVDDSRSFGDLAAALLEPEPGVEIVGVARNAAEGLEMTACLGPDIVLMDVQMSPMSGLTASTLIFWLFPRSRVVMMSMEDSPRLRAECVACGAQGFIHKPSFINDFFVAVGPVARDLVRLRKLPMFGGDRLQVRVGT